MLWVFEYLVTESIVLASQGVPGIDCHCDIKRVEAPDEVLLLFFVTCFLADCLLQRLPASERQVAQKDEWQRQILALIARGRVNRVLLSVVCLAPTISYATHTCMHTLTNTYAHAHLTQFVFHCLLQ